MLGHHRHASETPFQWRFAGGPMMARLWWYLDPPSPHQLKTVKVGPPLTKLSRYAHEQHGVWSECALVQTGLRLSCAELPKVHFYGFIQIKVRCH